VRALACAMVLAGAAAHAAPTETHRAELRAAHLAALLEAVRATPPATLAHAVEYARVLDRGQCAAPSERLEVECLMAAARRYCKSSGGARCNATLDVIISNVLADKQLIPPIRRYELMKGAKDPRLALERELRRIQGALAVDFRLRMGESGPSDDDAELARRIDRYCVSSADATSLPWQACASSLVWFLRTGGTR
jgi:hypothetical protein